MLGINPQGGQVISVDISSVLPQRILRAAVLDLKGNVLIEIKEQRNPRGNQELLSAIREIIEALLLSSGVEKEHVRAIGVSVPGLVNAETGELIFANIDVRDLAIAASLQSWLGIPVLVYNSEDVAALGEYYFGVGRGCRSLVYLSVGYGVGAGIVMDGKIYPHGRISAGEIGHITLQRDGPLCHCGNRGCLSALVNSERIVNQVRQARSQLVESLSGEIANELSVSAILAAAEQGDGLCRNVIDEAAEWIGIAVANVINLLNPEIIVFDGELFGEGDYFLHLVRAVVGKRALSHYLPSIKMLRSSLGRSAGLKGVGVLVMDEIVQCYEPVL
ncbi:MAG: ROK family protein [Chloroflexi bacterium]|nr:ROK family protein [Chloroflexota bacterium]